MNTKKLESLYENFISEIQPIYGKSHGLFTLHKGKNSEVLDKRILFLGRENRGQGNILENSKGFKIENDDLSWLKDKYKFTKSPFWRVMGKSLRDAYELKYTAEIFEHLYWTNLYKISPVCKNENTKKARQNQLENCKMILKQEILLVKPNIVVAFTGDWINAFKDVFNEKIKQTNKSIKTYNCDIEGHQFTLLALPHPQGKTERPIINVIIKNLIEQ